METDEEAEATRNTARNRFIRYLLFQLVCNQAFLFIVAANREQVSEQLVSLEKLGLSAGFSAFLRLLYSHGHVYSPLCINSASVCKSSLNLY